MKFLTWLSGVWERWWWRPDFSSGTLRVYDKKGIVRYEQDFATGEERFYAADGTELAPPDRAKE